MQCLDLSYDLAFESATLFVLIYVLHAYGFVVLTLVLSMLNATSNNISVITWRYVLLEDETTK